MGGGSDKFRRLLKKVISSLKKNATQDNYPRRPPPASCKRLVYIGFEAVGCPVPEPAFRTPAFQDLLLKYGTGDVDIAPDVELVVWCSVQVFYEFFHIALQQMHADPSFFQHAQS